MPNLEDIVPPLELCRKIPKGEFADSALVWHSGDYFKSYVEERCEGDVEHRWFGIFPAPTLAEILAALDSALDNVEAFSTEPRVLWCVKVDAGKFTERSECDVNPATAALRLWLNVEGIK